MARITGTLFRKGDSKEVVASVWPELEKFLESKGFSFYHQGSIQIGIHPYLFCTYLQKYGGLYVEGLTNGGDLSKKGRETNTKIKEDLLKSRAEFIRNLDKFNYETYATQRNLDSTSIFKNISIDPIGLEYRNPIDCTLQFYIIPEKAEMYVPFHEIYVGSSSTYKSRDKDQRLLEQALDPSSLIVKVRGDNRRGIEKAIKKEYRHLRG